MIQTIVSENMKLFSDGFKALNLVKTKRSALENNEQKGVDVPSAIDTYLWPKVMLLSTNYAQDMMLNSVIKFQRPRQRDS